MIDEQYKKGQGWVWKGAKMGLERGKNGIGIGLRMGFDKGNNGF